jgi:hypothetical protein
MLKFSKSIIIDQSNLHDLFGGQNNMIIVSYISSITHVFDETLMNCDKLIIKLIMSI